MDLLKSIESALNFNPYMFGEPHNDHEYNGWWVYSSPPIARFPSLYILFEIDNENRTVHLWSANFT
jgi:hypothetical protein